MKTFGPRSFVRLEREHRTFDFLVKNFTAKDGMNIVRESASVGRERGGALRTGHVCSVQRVEMVGD